MYIYIANEFNYKKSNESDFCFLGLLANSLKHITTKKEGANR